MTTDSNLGTGDQARAVLTRLRVETTPHFCDFLKSR